MFKANLSIAFPILILAFGLAQTANIFTAQGASLSEGTLEQSALVDRFSHALADGDTQRAGALLDPNVLIYESGAAERSREEYAAHHLGADAAFLKSTQYKILSRSSGTAADLAWVATEGRLTAKGAKPIDLIS